MLGRNNFSGNHNLLRYDISRLRKWHSSCRINELSVFHSIVMITKRPTQLLRNALSSAGQAIVSSITMWLLYRYLFRILPADQIGVWSLLFSAVSIGKIADMGIGSGVVKYVAQYYAEGDSQKASYVITTAFTASAVLIGSIMFVLYGFSSFILNGLNIAHGELINTLIPYALLSFLLSTLSGVLFSALDGYHRMDIRSGLNVIGIVLHFALSLYLTSIHGLVGLAYSQIAQSVFLILSAGLVLKFVIRAKSRTSVFHLATARLLLRYGLNAQLASVSISIFGEPLIKSMLTMFGGLGVVPFYDMVIKLITLLRSVVMSSMQALVPVVSSVPSGDINQIKEIYRQGSKSMILICVPIFSGLIAFAGYISLAWIGYVQTEFVWLIVLMAIAWGINTILVPAYFVNLGTGAIRPNTISHIVGGVANVILAYLLGLMFGLWGSVIGIALSVVITGFYPYLEFHRRYMLDSSIVFSKQTTLYAIVLFLASCIVFFYTVSIEITLFTSLESIAIPFIYLAISFATLRLTNQHTMIVALGRRILKL
jgi:O-antigen/teichoic acid export membrane protein